MLFAEANPVTNRLIHQYSRQRLIAAIMAIALPGAPVLSRPLPQPCEAVAAPEVVALSMTPIAASSLTDLPAVLVPLTALAVEDQRSIIAQQLESLGRPTDVAQQMAGELTADDLEVLLANPKMMQRAGEIDVIIWALLVAGVVVALVIAADSAVVVST
jgi:hypothetical protein